MNEQANHVGPSDCRSVAPSRPPTGGIGLLDLRKLPPKHRWHEVRKLVKQFKVELLDNGDIRLTPDYWPRHQGNAVAARFVSDVLELTIRRDMKQSQRLGSPLASVEELFEKQGGVCYLCGGLMYLEQESGIARATIDHIVPIYLGGTHDVENLRAAHCGCNGWKSNTTLSELQADWLIV